MHNPAELLVPTAAATNNAASVSRRSPLNTRRTAAVRPRAHAASANNARAAIADKTTAARWISATLKNVCGEVIGG